MQQPSRSCGWARAISTRHAIKRSIPRKCTATHKPYSRALCNEPHPHALCNEVVNVCLFLHMWKWYTLTKQLYLGSAFLPAIPIFYIFMESCDVRTQKTIEGIFTKSCNVLSVSSIPVSLVYRNTLWRKLFSFCN